MAKLPHHPRTGNDKPRQHRRRVALIDPALIDTSLLYRDSAGRERVGLLLETERQVDGTFLVVQAAPVRLKRQGVKGRAVGVWKFLHRKWNQEAEKPPKAEKAALPKMTNLSNRSDG